MRDSSLLYRPGEVMPDQKQGYKKVDNRFVPIQPPCIFATEKDCEVCGGGKVKKRKYCTKKGELNFLDCLHCTEREAPNAK